MPFRPETHHTVRPQLKIITCFLPRDSLPSSFHRQHRLLDGFFYLQIHLKKDSNESNIVGILFTVLMFLR